MNEIINCATYADGKRIADIKLSDVHAILQEKDQFVWIGVHEPSEEILLNVQREFNLHELAVEDAHNAHQRPKVELYADSIFVVLRTAQTNQQHHIEFGETHFFVGNNFIVVIRHGSSVPYTEVRARCASTPELMKKRTGFCFVYCDGLYCRPLFSNSAGVGTELELIEDKIFKEKPNRETTENIYDLKKELLEVKRAVSPLVDICNRLMRFDIKCISEETRPYFRDVYDHVLRINETVDDTREHLNSAMGANFSLISVSENEVSKKFSAWAAIIAVLTLVAGFYGMNFKFMPELNWHYGYYAVIFVAIFTRAALYYFLKRSGWL